MKEKEVNVESDVGTAILFGKEDERVNPISTGGARCRKEGATLFRKRLLGYNLS